jgi:galactose-1-phosphate uridylyltransferase
MFEETHYFRLQGTNGSKIYKLETEVTPKRREYSSRPHGINNQKQEQQQRCLFPHAIRGIKYIPLDIMLVNTVAVVIDERC